MRCIETSELEFQVAEIFDEVLNGSPIALLTGDHNLVAALTSARLSPSRTLFWVDFSSETRDTIDQYCRDAAAGHHMALMHEGLEIFLASLDAIFEEGKDFDDVYVTGLDDKIDFPQVERHDGRASYVEWWFGGSILRSLSPVDSPTIPSAASLVCPKCDFTWFEQRVGGVPVVCPVHHLALIAKPEVDCDRQT
jgi:hypothetical protein